MAKLERIEAPRTTGGGRKGRRFDWTLAFSRDDRMLRLCRMEWDGGPSPTGRPRTATLSLALRPVLFRLRRGDEELSLTLLCLRFHFRRTIAV